MTNTTDIIKQKLESEFNTGEALTRLCYDYYPDVYGKFSSSISYFEKLEKLVSHCEQKGQLDELVSHLRKPVFNPSKELSIEIRPTKRRLVFPSGESRLELIIEGNLSDFTPDVQNAYRKIFAALVKTSPELIEFIYMIEGSIVLRVDMPTGAAIELFELYNSSSAIFMQYLAVWRVRIDLSGANLSEADLSGANLRKGVLNLVDLNEADLSGADLRGSVMSLANLSGANLSGANLREAFLSGANLNGANLSDADLTGANMRETSLNGAVLWSANLQETDLREADLRETDLTDVISDEKTKWPFDLDKVKEYN